MRLLTGSLQGVAHLAEFLYADITKNGGWLEWTRDLWCSMLTAGFTAGSLFLGRSSLRGCSFWGGSRWRDGFPPSSLRPGHRDSGTLCTSWSKRARPPESPECARHPRSSWDLERGETQRWCDSNKFKHKESPHTSLVLLRIPPRSRGQGLRS